MTTASYAVASKKDVRADIRATRKALDRNTRRDLSDAVMGRAFDLPELAEAKRVACYCALPGEVDTARMITHCHLSGKALYLPRWMPEYDRYMFVRARHDVILQTGPMHVFEPVSTDTTPASALDLVFTPGLAFDAAGHRVGHGGGHYDRLLTCPPHAPRPTTVALAFDFQIFDELPASRHDIPMDMILTPTTTQRCAAPAIS